MIRLLAAATVSSVALSAQFTSPAGYLTTEGSSNHDYILFKYTDLRWQQLDATNLGQPAMIQRISWRRDGTSAFNAAWTARTLDIAVYLADSVLPAAISDNSAVNVFVGRPVHLPVWTQPPPQVAAPWDFQIQLDQPWVYTGLAPFLWELQITNNTTGADYGNDFQSTSGSTGTSTSGTTIGTGCVATGQTAAMSLAGTVVNQFVRFRASYTVTRAPANAPALLFLDLAQTNVQLPGLCGTAYVMPTIQIPLGTANASGAVPVFQIDDIPSQGAVGLVLYSQSAAIDMGQPGLPVTLSNARSHTFPAASGTPNPVTRVYGYRLPAGTMRAPSTWTGGIVTRFD